MSLAAHLLRQAAEISAKESTRRLGIDDWRANKVTPIALSLLMRGLLWRTETPIGAVLFAIRLDRYQEDILASQRRLSAPDIRARGRALSEGILGPYCNRAIGALADLGAIDPHRAAEVLSMTAAAAVSALSRAQRELGLKTFELRGVLKSEAAQVENADARLARQTSTWVFRPNWLSRLWDRIRSAILESPQITQGRPNAHLSRSAAGNRNALASQSEPRGLKADARFRVIAGERRADEAKADSILARTLRTSNTSRQQTVNRSCNDLVSKLTPRRAAACLRGR